MLSLSTWRNPAYYNSHVHLLSRFFGTGCIYAGKLGFVFGFFSLGEGSRVMSVISSALPDAKNTLPYSPVPFEAAGSPGFDATFFACLCFGMLALLKRIPEAEDEEDVSTPAPGLFAILLTPAPVLVLLNLTPTEEAEAEVAEEPVKGFPLPAPVPAPPPLPGIDTAGGAPTSDAVNCDNDNDGMDSSPVSLMTIFVEAVGVVAEEYRLKRYVRSMCV